MAVNKKNVMYSSERARLRLARPLLGFTLADLNRLTGYAISTLSNAEHERGPVSEELITRIADAMHVSLEWVKTGKGPMLKVNRSRAARELLETSIAGTRKEIARLTAQGEAQLKKAESLTSVLRQMEEWLDSIPRPSLTEDYAERNNAPAVELTLPNLIQRLIAVTSNRRGKKAEVARFLSVPMPRVSEWLASRSEPSGDRVLRLLRWVEQEEAKNQNGPGSADTPPEPEAQGKKSSDEIKTSDPTEP